MNTEKFTSTPQKEVGYTKKRRKTRKKKREERKRKKRNKCNKMKTTPFISHCYISIIQTTNNLIYRLAKTLFSILGFRNVSPNFFSLANFRSTKFMFVFGSLSDTKHFYCFAFQ